MIDADKGIVEYIASDESIDSDREIILASGWRFNRFRKNSPFLNSHRRYSVDDVLGKVLSADLVDGQLVERVQWAIDIESNDLAKLGFAMTQGGYLKAVSVGFTATSHIYNSHEGWEEALIEAGLTTAQGEDVYRIFTQQEQTELSAVVIGANPNALVKSYEEGAVSEELLSKCGFGTDESYEFLSTAAAAVESPACNDAFKAMIGIEMQRIYSYRDNNFQKSKQPSPDTHAKKLAAARAVEQRADAQSAFLKQMESLTK